MTVSAQTAHSIFSGIILGQEEAVTALSQLSDEDMEQYQQHVREFNAKLEDIGTQAQTELELIKLSSELHLKPEDMGDWDIQDWRDLLDALEGTLFERLHVNMCLRVPNNKQLLELVKP